MSAEAVAAPAAADAAAAPAAAAVHTPPSSDSAAAVGAGGNAGAGAVTAAAPDGEAVSGVKLEDGTERVEEAAIARFTKWLADNGARYPKIQWPSYATVGGVRGTVALEDIKTNEPMMYIPEKLLMSPPVARASEIGHVFEENPDLFGRYEDDRVLAVYICYERGRGDESFYAPYLAMLPHPGSILDWSSKELGELQNDRLALEAQCRRPRLKLKYEQTCARLLPKYPHLFQADGNFTFEKFEFAWMTVQARAFGRFLPYTALVPFADCLNHTNVQTKYDFNVDENGEFRLFPTGRNHYNKGEEVFNSYGRRNNRHLLLEYGFAIENNQWEAIPVTMVLDSEEPLFLERREVMHRYLFSTHKTYSVKFHQLCNEIIGFCRLAVMNEEELENTEAHVQFYYDPLSTRNERAALQLAIATFRKHMAAFKSSIEQDEELQAQPGIPPRLAVALAYRLTRKRIVAQQIAMLQVALAAVDAFAAMPLLAPEDAVSNQLVKYVHSLATHSAAAYARRQHPPRPKTPSADDSDSDGDGDSDSSDSVFMRVAMTDAEAAADAAAILAAATGRDNAGAAEDGADSTGAPGAAEDGADSTGAPGDSALAAAAAARVEGVDASSHPSDDSDSMGDDGRDGGEGQS